MLAESVRNMVKRSTPRPQPPVGGRPYSSELQKVSSIICASSSPAALSCHPQRVPPSQPVPFSRRRPATIHIHGGRRYLGLVGEALALRERVVQLGVRVAHLLLAHEELKALGQAGYAPVPVCACRGALGVSMGERRLKGRDVAQGIRLGQRAHELRVVADEGRADAGDFQKVADKLEHPGACKSASVCGQSDDAPGTAETVRREGGTLSSRRALVRGGEQLTLCFLHRSWSIWFVSMCARAGGSRSGWPETRQ